MKREVLILAGMFMLLSGCASIPEPEPGALSQLPVIEFGQPVPADGNYVLHFPQDKSIEMPVSFEGNLFQAPTREVLSVKLNRDIYVHKEWLSYDGKNWIDANGAMDLQVHVVIPGYSHPEPGYVLLEMNAVE
ncbi:MAG: hypothetical protein P8103_16910 [Candidatus Thiodiazotropha sp.]